MTEITYSGRTLKWCTTLELIIMTSKHFWLFQCSLLLYWGIFGGIPCTILVCAHFIFLPLFFMFRKEFSSAICVFLFQEIDYKKLYLPKNVSLYDSTQIMDSNPIKTAIVVCNKLIREQVLIKIEVGIYFRSMFNWLPWDQDQTNHRIQSEKNQWLIVSGLCNHRQ